MKKFAIVLVILLLVVVGFVVYFNFFGNNKSNFNEELNSVNSTNVVSNTINDSKKSNNEVANNTASTNENTTVSATTPTTDKNLTKEDATKLLEDKFGKVDEQTGNQMSYSFLATVQDKEGNKYYAFRESWLVDHSHLSFLQNVFVSLDGKTIKATGEPAGYEENQVVDLKDAQIM